MLVRDAMLVERAKRLRREATPPERAVWRLLRAPPFDALHFRRQVAFGAVYIADFASLRAKVVVEVDGRSHDFSAVADAERTAWFEAQGYRVVRVSNWQVGMAGQDLAALLGSLVEV